SEEISAHFDGMKPVEIRVTSAYNKYTLSRVMNGTVDQLTLNGNRIQVSPRNTIHASVVKTGNAITFYAQNTGFNDKIGGTVRIEVEYYEKRALWADKLLAKREFTIQGGTRQHFSNPV